MTPLRIALVGAGRMGREIASLAAAHGCEVVATIGSREGPPTRARLHGAEVALEFTTPAAAVPNIRALLEAGCPTGVGTTGWYDQLDDVRALVERAHGSLLWAANFSLGVAILEALAVEAGRLLAGARFDAHLVETHHTAKRDAPSGTAIVLARAAGTALGRDVPITSVRTGSVPGTHALVFDAPFEQLRLEHDARDRRVFAEGALVAARWLPGRRGIYTMRDVLANANGSR